MLGSFFNQEHFRGAILDSQHTKNSQELENAKQYPIQKLYNGELKRTGKILMGCCPFHQEDTPSFAIYTETNTWNCFAKCGGGDAIAFYMKLKGVSFSEALQELNK